MPTADQEYINKMYDSSLTSQKESLKQNYDQAVSDLDAEQQKAQKQTDANLNRTYVEAAKAAKNYNEVQNAYGLSSGAMGQARLAQDNQMQANMTAIRAAQQSVDADVEREKTLLSREYASAIAKAQADNDLARAQALYEQAKADEDALLQRQKEAANLMAGAGDYSLIAQLYGLSPEQAALLQGGGTGGTSGGGTYDGNYTPAETPEAADTGTDSTITNYNDESGVQVGNQKLSWIELEMMVASGRITEKVNPQTGKVTYAPSSTYSGTQKNNNQKTGTGTSGTSATGKESGKFLRG